MYRIHCKNKHDFGTGRKSSGNQLIFQSIPDGTVSSRLVDELRCKVNLGVVRPRAVFWDVMERTWCIKIDAQVEHEGGGPARVVGVDGEVCL